ncbi:MAG: site-specific integrase [Anaerolineales bacterium]|nr:site-specific integrase [Anaerolineales bacterium]
MLFGVLIRLRLPLAQVLRLQVKDLSLETGALALKNTTVALPAELIAAFVGYFRQFPERLRSNGPLFPSRRGQAMDRLAFRRRIVEPALRQVAPGFKPSSYHPAKFPLAIQQRLLVNPLDPRRMSQRNELVCQLLIWLGLRPEEFSRIRQRDIEFGHDCIVLRDTKSGGDQEVPIPKPLIAVLKAFVEPLEPDDLVFRQDNGRPMHRRQVELAIKAWSELRDLRGVTPQIVRRSLATILEDRGASPVQVESLLRHAGTSTLRRHYSRPSLQRAAAALEFHPLNEIR